MQTIFRIPVYIIALILTLSISSLQLGTFAQSNLRIFDVPGGGGGSGTSQTDEGSDNTAIYVVGGLVIAGILAYALFFKEKKKDTDTTASLNSNLIYSEVIDLDNTEANINQVKDRIPVDLFLGIRNNEAILNDRIYHVGLRVKL